MTSVTSVTGRSHLSEQGVGPAGGPCHSRVRLINPPLGALSTCSRVPGVRSRVRSTSRTICSRWKNHLKPTPAAEAGPATRPDVEGASAQRCPASPRVRASPPGTGRSCLRGPGLRGAAAPAPPRTLDRVSLSRAPMSSWCGVALRLGIRKRRLDALRLPSNVAVLEIIGGVAPGQGPRAEPAVAANRASIHHGAPAGWQLRGRARGWGWQARFLMDVRALQVLRLHV